MMPGFQAGGNFAVSIIGRTMRVERVFRRQEAGEHAGGDVAEAEICLCLLILWTRFVEELKRCVMADRTSVC